MPTSITASHLRISVLYGRHLLAPAAVLQRAITCVITYHTRRLYFLRRLLPMACGAWGKPAVPRSTLPTGGSWVLTAGPGTPLQRTGGLSAELATGLGLGICFFSPSQDLLGLGGCFFIFP